MPVNESIKNEIVRKLIHILTTIIPVLYIYYLDRKQIIIVTISLFILFLIGDLFRMNVTKMGQIYDKILGKLLRTTEKGKRLNGATLLLFGFSISVLLFEKDIAIISMLILALSDSFAALIGKWMGKVKFRDKTLEGSIAFFVMTWLIAGFFIENVGINALGAALLTICELFSDKLNDNISIPLFSGVFFTLARNL